MSKIADSEAARLVGEAMIEHNGSIKAAFDSLDLGFSFDDVIVYAQPVVRRTLARDEAEVLPRMVGLIAAAMAIGAEQERLRSAADVDHEA